MEFMSAPLGAFKWLKKWIEKKFFLDLYQQSHLVYMRRISKPHYRHLTQGIEYDLQLESEYFSNKSNPVSAMLIKFPNGAEGMRLKGKVISESGEYQQQDNFDVCFEGKSKIRLKLPEMPLLNYIPTKKGIALTVTNIYLTGVLINEKGDEIPFETERTHPLYNEFLNSEYAFKWGFAWNLDHLYREISDFRHRVLYTLLGDSWMLSSYRPASGFRENFQACYTKVILNTIGHEKVCNGIYWVMLRTGMRKL